MISFKGILRHSRQAYSLEAYNLCSCEGLASSGCYTLVGTQRQQLCTEYPYFTMHTENMEGCQKKRNSTLQTNESHLEILLHK